MNTEPQTAVVPTEDDADLASTWLDRAIVWLGKKLSLIFAIVAIIGCYEVVRRYVFNAPTFWVHETATFLGASLFIFGGLYAFATDKHVRVVLIYDHLSERGQRALRIVHHLFGLGFCAMMLYASSIMAKKAVLTPWGAFRLETSGSAWNPPFPALLKVMVLLAIVVLTLQYLLHLLRDLRQWRRKA